MMNSGEADKSDARKNLLTQRVAEWTTYISQEPSVCKTFYENQNKRGL
jgi:hypothetical protein